MKEIRSYNELSGMLKADQKAYFLLWKKGSEQSDCAFTGMKSASDKHPEIPVFSADVSIVRDIHTAYNIVSVPSLLQFDGYTLKNVILLLTTNKTKEYFDSLDSSLFRKYRITKVFKFDENSVVEDVFQILATVV